MKKLSAILLAAALLLSLAACRTETETKYLRTSTTQEYIGTVTFRTETEYDSEGRQTTFTQYTDGEEPESSRVEYTYTDNSIIGLTTQGDQTSTMTQVYEEDESGNITRIETYMDDVLYAVTERTFDDQGNCLTNVQNTIAIEKTYTTSYTYDENGNQLTVTYDHGDGMGAKYENTYDENGNLNLTLIYDLSGNLTSREEHTWTTDTSEQVEIYDGKGNLTSSMSITYDEHGNMLTSETYDAAGTLTLRITYTYKAFEVPVK